MVIVPPGWGGSPASAVVVVALTATTPVCTCLGAAVGGVNFTVVDFFAVVVAVRAAVVGEPVCGVATVVVAPAGCASAGATVDAVVEDVSAAGSGDRVAAFSES